jgi:hypothetical protein
MPASPGGTPLTLPQDCQGVMLVTVHPESVAPAVLSSIGIVMAVGGASEEVIRGFCDATGQPMPQVPA